MAEGPFVPRFVLPVPYAFLRGRGHTAGEIRGPRWRQTSRGFYVPAGTPDTPWQRVANAGVRLTPGGAVGTWAAAGLHGVGWCDGYAADGKRPLPIALFTGRDRHIRSLGCSVSQEPLPADEVEVRHGIPCTRPLRTCFDGMRLSPTRVEAVVFADMLLAAGLVELGALHAYLNDHRGWRGMPLARSAARLALNGTRGPWETRLRMVWVLAAGLPSPMVNVPVFDLRGRRFIGIPDLFDPDAGVAWEFDGGGHREARQHAADNIREERLEEVGILVGRASALDFADVDGLAGRMVRVHRRGLRRDRAADAWTLTAPPTWYAGDARSALREALLAMEPDRT